jgi:hypothetical protein
MKEKIITLSITLSVGITIVIFGPPIIDGIFNWITKPAEPSYEETLRARIEGDLYNIKDIDTKLKVLDMIKNEHDTTRLAQIERAIDESR